MASTYTNNLYKPLLNKYGNPEQAMDLAMENLNKLYKSVNDPNYGAKERELAKSDMLAANMSMANQAKRDAAKMGTSAGSAAGARVRDVGSQRVAEGVANLAAAQERQKSADLMSALGMSGSLAQQSYNMGAADRSFLEDVRRYEEEPERQKEYQAMVTEFQKELIKTQGDVNKAIANIQKVNPGWGLFGDILKAGASLLI